ncbi:uncharacterized protein LOC114761581 [Neltuma alba]|uniref:uncharacterized protein LOC114742207 n=1 Tax=Neltuma alba TaxID=207710 RepID=UPI0010A4B5D8|nr:uncharacterized protein LOC114742207 [Prosopis alba]XP_028806820.1 uncharacterized protein LOC114761581 [Prosopis alba]
MAQVVDLEGGGKSFPNHNKRRSDKIRWQVTLLYCTQKESSSLLQYGKKLFKYESLSILIVLRTDWVMFRHWDDGEEDTNGGTEQSDWLRKAKQEKWNHRSFGLPWNGRVHWVLQS